MLASGITPPIHVLATAQQAKLTTVMTFLGTDQIPIEVCSTTFCKAHFPLFLSHQKARTGRAVHIKENASASLLSLKSLINLDHLAHALGKRFIMEATSIS